VVWEGWRREASPYPDQYAQTPAQPNDIVSNEALIAPESMRARPWEPVAIRRPCQMFIEPSRRLAAGEGEGKDAVLRRRGREQPIRHLVRQGLGIGEDFQFGFARAGHERTFLFGGRWASRIAAIAAA